MRERLFGILVMLAVVAAAFWWRLEDRRSELVGDHKAPIAIPASVGVKFRAEKGEQPYVNRDGEGGSVPYVRIVSMNKQPVTLAKIVVNGRDDQEQCVFAYNKVLRLGDVITAYPHTDQCGDAVEISVVTSDPPSSTTYDF